MSCLTRVRKAAGIIAAILVASVFVWGIVEYKPQRIRRLILNKPFFIAMQERTGKQPWFMG